MKCLLMRGNQEEETQAIAAIHTYASLRKKDDEQ
jgi:hypothetical protein